MDDEETPQLRLARAVRDRRTELGLSVRAACKIAEVSRGTWQALEEASRVTQDRHYGGIQRALQWPVGRIVAILGDRPLRAVPTAPAANQPDLRDDVERKLWAITDLSEEERWSYIDQHRVKQARRRYGD